MKCKHSECADMNSCGKPDTRTFPTTGMSDSYEAPPSGMPKWVASHATTMKHEECDMGCPVIKALAIAVKALEVSTLTPYKDSDLKWLIQTINTYSKHALKRIHALGNGEE